MNKLKLILIFVFLLLLDGLILPGLFGFREGMLTIAFLLAILLNWGPTPGVLWLGSGVSLFLEFFWQFPIGSLLLMFLLAALTYYLISSVLSVKRYTAAVSLSFALPFIVFNGGWGLFNNIVGTTTVLASFIMCFFLFNKICSEEKNIKFL